MDRRSDARAAKAAHPRLRWAYLPPKRGEPIFEVVRKSDEQVHWREHRDRLRPQPGGTLLNTKLSWLREAQDSGRNGSGSAPAQVESVRAPPHWQGADRGLSGLPTQIQTPHQTGHLARGRSHAKCAPDKRCRAGGWLYRVHTQGQGSEPLVNKL